MEQPEQIRLSEILVSTEKPRTSALQPMRPSKLAAAQAKAEDLLAQIRKGAAFEESPRRIPTGPPPPRVAISDISSAAHWPRNLKTRHLP